jgi:hypothetical protein
VRDTGTGSIGAMGVSRLLMRRSGYVGLALTTYDIWRRIPPNHRRTILKQARKHGPRVAKMVASQYRSRGSR